MNPGPNDLRLIATAHDVACVAEVEATENDAPADEVEQRRQAAAAAWARCEGTLRDMAAIPAERLPGIAVKARKVLAEYDDGGGTLAGAAVARSLADDLDRLTGPVAL